VAANVTQILEAYWKEHPAWFGRPYGEYLHLGANQEMLRILLDGQQIGPDARIIDLSCALGGNARWLASLYGCKIDGVDSFKPAVLCARHLAKVQGLAELCRFVEARSDQLPFSTGLFDYAITSEGESNRGEVARVLKRGGLFLGSAVAAEGAERYVEGLEKAGFTVEKLIDVTSYALSFYKAKEEEAKLLVAAGLMDPGDVLALQMHTVDLYEAGGAHHVLFRARRRST